MQRKAYVPGVAMLLAAVLTACTGSEDSGSTDDPLPGDAAATASTAEPGRYDTLPEPCGSIEHGTLDSFLPGIKQLTDEEQRQQAYEGAATQTYDTDRKAGCRWKVESATATDYLFIVFERVVSYDGAVSDDSKAQEVYGVKVEAADLPEPSPSESADESADDSTASPSDGTASGSASASDSPNSSNSPTPSTTASPTASETPPSLQPRTLDGLGDEAFLDDALGTSRQRTVTVVFRTSNVIVTVEYEEQPATTTDVPDSEEMQDRARKLAERLAESFDD